MAPLDLENWPHLLSHKSLWFAGSELQTGRLRRSSSERLVSETEVRDSDDDTTEAGGHALRAEAHSIERVQPS